MFVENGCVHQHFNDDPDNEAILLVFKAKPLFLFMHLLVPEDRVLSADERRRVTRISSRRRIFEPTHRSKQNIRPMSPPRERDVAHVGEQDLQLPRRRRRGIGRHSARTTIRCPMSWRPRTCRFEKFARRPDQASGAQKRMDTQGMLRRSLYAVPASGRALRQAPAHVGGGDLRRRRSGYDLHWDLKFDCVDAFQWDWAAEPEALRMAARRFHLRPALLHPSAFQHGEAEKRG